MALLKDERRLKKIEQTVIISRENHGHKRSYYINSNNSVKNLDKIEDMNEHDENKVDNVVNELNTINETLKK